ncbi:MAG: response regulator [Chloroflexota bacterium]
MSGNQKIRVMIVDDHNMVRKGLVVLLEGFDDLEIVADVGDGELAYNHCHEDCPDVILMDMIMPRVNGVEATRLIKEVCPETQIIALTSFSDETKVQDALQAGAIGYLMKDVSGNELANAIRRAHVGESTLAPAAAQVLIQATARPPSLGHDLTNREREVLALMIDGLNNREIGERLVISNSTVKNHVSSILSKLQTTSRTQAVALAVEHKIVEHL